MSEEELVAQVLVGLTSSSPESKSADLEEPVAKVAGKGGKRPSKPSSSEEGESCKKKRVKKGKVEEKEHIFPVEPRVIQVIKKPKTYINHSYRDFSAVPAELDHVEPTNIDEMTFAQKVHRILSQSEYEQSIAWMPHGRAFRIIVPIGMERMGILKKYFSHNRFSSFLRQLNNFGFKHISQGPDRNCYYHELLLREVPHLAKYMPEAKDARRMIPDPDNEPDFERISKVFPLPDAQAKALELALAVRNANASKMGSSGLQQQHQSATNNNWVSSYPSMGGVTGMVSTDFNRSVSMPQQQHSIAPSMAIATAALEAAQAQAAKRVKNAVAAAFHLQAELGIQERQAQAAQRVKDAVAAAIQLEAEFGAQERQNVALVMKFAAQRQQANPLVNQSVESFLWQSQNNFLGYPFR